MGVSYKSCDTHRDAERKRRVKQIEGWLQEERHDAKIERIKKNK